KEQGSVLGREFLQASIQTLAWKTFLFGSFRGDLYLINVHLRPLFSQSFTIDVLCDAVAISDLAFDFFFGCFQYHAVDGFIGQFIGKAALALRKESTQTKTQPLILLACALHVGAQPLEKVEKLLTREFALRPCVSQCLRPRFPEGEFRAQAYSNRNGRYSYKCRRRSGMSPSL